MKAFMRSPSGAMSASLIDLKKGARITNEFEMDRGFDQADIILHVIVHGIWDPEVREVSLGAIEKVCKEFGIKYTIIKDYYETEKGIAHHLKK